MSLVKPLLICGCIFSALAKPPPYAKEAQEVTKTFAEQVVREKKFTTLGSGGFYTDKRVDSLYVDFELVKVASEAEAMALLQSTVDGFLVYVNSRESLRPFLRTYPVTADQVSVSIAFIDEKRAPVQGLSQIHLYAGEIVYSSYNAKQKRYESYQKELWSVGSGAPGGL